MLVRWNPSYNPFLSDFRSLQRQVDHVFRELLPKEFVGPTRAGPTFEVTDEGERYVIVAALPGVAREDLELEATDHSLSVSGKRSVEVPEGYRELKRERGALEFSEAFEFKSPLDLEKVEAKLENGILRIELTKQAKAQPRTIAIKAA